MGGQLVVIEDAHHAGTNVTSDPAGRYSVTLPPGSYTLMCGPMPTFTVTPGETIHLDCELAVA